MTTQSGKEELVEQCLCCGREERIYGAFPDAHKQGNIYCGTPLYGVRHPFLSFFPLSLAFLLKNKLWYYTNLVKQWYAKQVILILKLDEMVERKDLLSFFCKVRGKLVQNCSFQGGHYGDMVSFIQVRE